MKRCLLALLILLLGCTTEGRESSSPGRIVSVSVVTDEILLSLVSPERVAGVSIYAADPDKSYVAERAMDLRPLRRDDTDAILALDPDLVLLSTLASKEVEQLLLRAGVRVARVPTPTSLDDIRQSIRSVAAAVDEKDKGEALIRDMDRKLQEFQKLPKANLEALYYTPGGWTSGRDTNIDVLLEHAGLNNAASVFQGHKMVSLEWVLESDPDVILVGEGYQRFAGWKEALRNDHRFKSLTAVQNQHIVGLPNRVLFTISHFIADAVLDLRRQLTSQGISQKPQRIVSLTLASSEILLDLVPLDRIAGLHAIVAESPHSNVRGRLQGVPLIVSDVEQIIDLKPDLIIVASYVAREFIAPLEKAGLPVVTFTQFDSVESVFRNIEMLGALVGESAAAEEIIRRTRAEIMAIQSLIPDQMDPLRVVAIGASGSIAGSRTTVHSLITLARARNIAAEHGIEGNNMISAEHLVLWDPDIIVVARDADKDNSLKQQLLAEDLFAPLRDKRIVEIPYPHYSTVSHYFVEGLHDLVQGIYP